ncbi:SOLUTE CARRIER FAMILY 25 (MITOCHONDRIAL CARRIER PHOSPHATE CARRIER) MEMBER 3 LIKE-RELATED-RELATED [Salix purpurea]|uniref:SOLUTE CARRIER FAMILY 25 (MITOCHONDRIAL CARRIER PHOSPHATE CARRIER) MEMBER 3 LIKE-RELATED-RELATED n=1 Tax=Salix purpurea TaxID=77065 RepID=A0A9Q0VGT7_SALPP|nr:SOLUTE CARRIER FAMILY 25 (MITOCHONDRIAL CARRIER PHOSPHATE CARRIER) MEMBER 3 LIKE-RELATED-RELATED [Salix purpurea]
MAQNNHSCQSLIPGFLYSSSVGSSYNGGVPQLLQQSKLSPPSNSCDHGVLSKNFVIPAPSEKIEMFSPAYYLACTAGGVFSCGLTHMTIDPSKYKSITSGFGVLLKEQGARGFFRGWVPTLLGYSAQGACKFGFYEFFKKYYSDMAGPENAAKYKTLIYLAGSASAELIADVALCPMEAVKVRVQTQPGFARGLADGMPKFLRSEGYSGLYKGLVPLWGRQIPYTMMKFASFRDYCGATIQECHPNTKRPVQQKFAAWNQLCWWISCWGATAGDAVRQLGLWGLFTRGLPLRIVMIGTLTGAQWGIYDAFKVFVGLPTTGGSAPAPAVAKP